MPESHHIESYADVEHKVQVFLNELCQGRKPYTYMEKCPVYVSDNVPEGEIWFIPKKDSKCWK